MFQLYELGVGVRTSSAIHFRPQVMSPTIQKSIFVDALTHFITGFATRLTRWVPLVEVELLTLPEHLSSPPVFSGLLLLDL